MLVLKIVNVLILNIFLANYDLFMSIQLFRLYKFLTLFRVFYVQIDYVVVFNCGGNSYFI